MPSEAAAITAPAISFAFESIRVPTQLAALAALIFPFVLSSKSNILPPRTPEEPAGPVGPVPPEGPDGPVGPAAPSSTLEIVTDSA